MRKLVNIRYPLLIFCGTVLGILCAVLLFYGKVFLAVCLFLLIAAVAVAALCKRRFFPCLFLLLGLAGGLVSSYVSNAVMENGRIFCDEKVLLKGYVADRSVSGDYCTVTVRDAGIVFADGTEKQLSSAVTFRYYCGDNVPSTGDALSARGKIANRYIFKDSVEVYAYKNRCLYSLENVSDVRFSAGKRTFAEEARAYIRTVVYQKMPGSASVACALLLGDKSDIDGSTMENFRNAGVAHVLAVSGLHVGFIAGVFLFVLKRLRVRPQVQLPVVLIPLCFYAYLCGFPASVVRAVVMTATALAAKAFLRRSDMLNSLACAGILLLLFRPFYLFDVGFVLSFSAVFGIATVTAACNRGIKRKIGNKYIAKFLNGLSLSFGAVCGSAVPTMYYFGNVSLIGLLTNVFVVPLTSLSFIVTAVGLVPFLHFLLVPADALLFSLEKAASLFAQLPFSHLEIYVAVPAIAASFLLLFLLGGYVNFTKRVKAVVASLLCVALTAGVLMVYLPKSEGEYVRVMYAESDLCAVASDGNGNYCVVSDFDNGYDTQNICSALSRRRIRTLSVCIADGNAADERYLTLFASCFDVDDVFVFSGQSDVADKVFGEKTVVVPSDTAVGDAVRVTQVTDGVPLGLLLRTKNLSVLLVTSEAERAVRNVYKTGVAPDAVYSVGLSALLSVEFPASVPLQKTESANADIYSTTERGNFTIVRESGIISVKYGRDLV